MVKQKFKTTNGVHLQQCHQTTCGSNRGSNDVWKEKVGYHRRIVVETAMRRFKILLDAHLSLRNYGWGDGYGQRVKPNDTFRNATQYSYQITISYRALPMPVALIYSTKPYSFFFCSKPNLQVSLLSNIHNFSCCVSWPFQNIKKLIGRGVYFSVPLLGQAGCSSFFTSTPPFGLFSLASLTGSF